MTSFVTLPTTTRDFTIDNLKILKALEERLITKAEAQNIFKGKGYLTNAGYKKSIVGKVLWNEDSNTFIVWNGSEWYEVSTA